MHWFYEVDGQKVGPVPAKTIRQLARKGVIQPQTSLWSGAAEKPIQARRVHDLFASDEPTPNPEIQRASEIMSVALAACRDDKEDLLDEHEPPITAFHPFASTHVLLDYKVACVEEVPPPPITTVKTRGIAEKPVQRTFKIVVETELCFRTTHRTKISELRQTTPGHKNDSFTYRAREFVDGRWEIDSP